MENHHVKWDASGPASLAPTLTRRLRPHLRKVQEQPFRVYLFKGHGGGGDLETSQKIGSYLKEHKQPFKELTPRGYNASGTSWNLPQEDVATPQERPGSYCTKMLQCMRSIMESTARR